MMSSPHESGRYETDRSHKWPPLEQDWPPESQPLERLHYHGVAVSQMPSVDDSSMKVVTPRPEQPDFLPYEPPSQQPPAVEQERPEPPLVDPQKVAGLSEAEALLVGVYSRVLNLLRPAAEDIKVATDLLRVVDDTDRSDALRHVLGMIETIEYRLDLL